MPELSTDILNSESWPVALAASTALLIAVSLLYARSSASKKSLPPGPRGVPWIGQVFDIPLLHTHLYYTELAAKYGDIYTVTALGQKLIVLNTYQIAFDLLAKRGSIHCNRPPFPYLRRFLGLEYIAPLINTDHSWKEGRRLYQTLLNKEVSRINYSKDITSQANGTAEESFVLGLLREQSPANEHLLKVTGLTNMVAGAETTNGICRVFVLAMLLHPKVQRKVQEELDQVLAQDLPSMDSLQNLPYFDAVLKEVLRWRPLTPISIPTVPTKDDTYGGYLIPHDSIVIQNTWAISRDERMYPDAESFNPDRWLVPNPPVDPRLWLFGIGRRICPGMQYAELVYLTMFATLLATVDIVPAHDSDGKEIFVDPTAPTTGRVASIPNEFSYSLRPRSDAAVALLREAVAA
ncbi:cytochrome P450 [Clavulina sp. PMI_390]|nr:cytochrome P450 [Clavulina sp. PMI_390]